MPILDVEIVGEPGVANREALAQRIADAAGEVLNSPPQGTWVRIRVLPPEDYAENGGSSIRVQPVFVSVMKRTVPQGELLVSEIRSLTDVVAAACGRPLDNVHVRYEAPGSGRQAFGGELV